MKSYLQILKKNADFALKDEDAVVKALEKSRDNETEEEQVYIAKKIEEDSKRVAELSNKIEKLYDDWLDKRISESNFQRILEKSQEEQELLTKRIEKMEKRVVTREVNEVNIHKWIELIKKHKNIKKLDKETLNELISKIYVHEKEVVDGEITQIIEIHYNFIGNTDNLQVSYNL